MRVAYVTMQFPVPSETFATNDVRQLKRTGLEIDVFTLRASHHDRDRLLVERDLTSVSLSANGLGPSMRGAVAALARPRLLARSIMWLWRTSGRRPPHLAATLALLPRAFGILSELEKRTPDIVHIFWGHYPSVVGYLVKERLPGVPVSIALNAYDLTMRYGGSVDVARRADFVRTHSFVNVKDVARFAGISESRINVIYNGVDVDWLDGIAGQITKVPRRIAVAGRLISSKAMDDVLRVHARVRTRWPGATLMVMGDGPERESLKRLARALGVSDSVSFLGHVPHSRVVAELAKAEVLLFLSKKESERLPNVVKEGMACRCICVTSDTPGISELIEPGRSGFIMQAGDIEAIANVVDDVFSGRVDVATMVERARTHIEATFDLRVTTDKYRRHWQSLLALPRNSARRDETSSSGAAEEFMASQKLD
jgi:colanic acid/amylovoran biosynthesis glycosyltransferase